MADCKGLLERALRNPKGLRFVEICSLAECFGFEFTRQRGSHRIYKNPRNRSLMNFQNVKGMAKPFQVRQLLNALEEMGLLSQEGMDE